MKTTFNPYNRYGQIVIMLLSVFNNQKGILSKQEVIHFISDEEWFSFGEGDSVPYPSCKTNEPRWETLIAFARMNCVKSGLFEKDGCHDSWEITKNGRNEFVRIKQLFEVGELDCSRCYLWSGKFKKFIASNYKPLPTDEKRPVGFYDDHKPKKTILLEDL